MASSYEYGRHADFNHIIVQCTLSTASSSVIVERPYICEVCPDQVVDLFIPGGTAALLPHVPLSPDYAHSQAFSKVCATADQASTGQ
jgi:hypothetical protein